MEIRLNFIELFLVAIGFSVIGFITCMVISEGISQKSGLVLMGMILLSTLTIIVRKISRKPKDKL